MKNLTAAIERITEKSKKEMVSHIGWRLMEIIIYDDGEIGVREAGDTGDHENEIAGHITLDIRYWRETLEELGAYDEENDAIVDDLDDETIERIAEAMLEVAEEN